MATYIELNNLASGGEGTILKTKIKVAIIIAAEAIRSEEVTVDNHSNRMIWAAAAFTNPGAMAEKMLWALLAQNASAEATIIAGASDTTIQSGVNAAVDIFATG